MIGPNSVEESPEAEEKEMTIDEYIESLKSKLSYPRRLYGFNSLYDFLGKDNSQKGIILIDSNLNFAGELSDRSSRFKKHVVQGRIDIDENRVCIYFAKIPPGFAFNTIHYKLEKELSPGRFEREGLTGNYDGWWSFDEKALNIARTEVPGLGTALGIKSAEQSNKAGLWLYKICPDIYQGWHYYPFQKY